MASETFALRGGILENDYVSQSRRARRARSALTALTVVLVVVLSLVVSSHVDRDQPGNLVMKDLQAVAGISPEAHAVVPAGRSQEFRIRAGDGSLRTYVVTVPSTYSPRSEEPLPVLFAFHGWKGRAGDFIDNSFYQTTAPEEAIIVMPGGKSRAWAGAPYAETTVKQDIDYVKQLLGVIRNEFVIDESRIYGLGISNGGGMVANLACQESEIFAAIALVAAAYYTPVKAGCSKSPIPVLTVHGTADDTIPYYGGRRHNIFISPVLEETATYARRNSCPGAGESPFNLFAQSVTKLQGCSSATAHIRVEGGSHAWPKNPHLNQEIWNFLAKNKR